MTALKTKGLKLTYSNGNSETKYIYKGKSWTPFQFCVDHGDYYEVALWSSYLRIDKKTMATTSNRKDVNNFLPDNGVTVEIVLLKSVEGMS